MKIDQDYDNTEAAQGGQYNPPPPGGYVLQVLEVYEEPSKSGKDMVTLSFDIADGEFAGAFERFPKKYFQLVNGDNLPYFKAMIQAFEESNNFTSPLVDDGDFNPQRLKNKLVGGCIREAEYRAQDGSVKVGLEIAFLCSLDRLPEIKPPKLKKLAGQTARGGSVRQPVGAGASMADDNLPF